MNYPAAEPRGIEVIPVKTLPTGRQAGIQNANALDSRSKERGNDRQRNTLLTPKQSFEEFF